MFKVARFPKYQKLLLGPLEKVSKCPGRLVKNPGNIWDMTSETDGFSVAGEMWTTTQQTCKP